ncbi:hypothetical protein GQ457_01G022830 [Hibiscus cannabinus]
MPDSNQDQEHHSIDSSMHWHEVRRGDPPTYQEAQNNPPNSPLIHHAQQECYMTMAEMFKQFIVSLRSEQAAQPFMATSFASKAPIDKLAQDRAYTFTGKDDDNLKIVGYWLDNSLRILNKKIRCSDEHKLECALALIADGAQHWWETTTLMVPEEVVTWEFFLKEFCKKVEYIKTEEEKCRMFIYGLNDELCPLFTALGINDFQSLVNRVIAAEAIER